MRRNEKLFLYGQCTEHFDMGELTESGHAVKHGIVNMPGEEQQGNLKVLCRNYLEPLRLHLGEAVRVNSAYRCPELNMMMDGSRGSWHLQGAAADIYCGTIGRAINVLHFFRKHFAEQGVSYDECYAKMGCEAWYVHVAFNPAGREHNRMKDNLREIRALWRMDNKRI